MAIAIKSMNDLKTNLNKRISIAVETACNRLLGSLQEIIDTEFYDVFTPDYYHRTYQFWSSAVTTMLTENCGEVFMDKSKMDYNTFWTGEIQLQAANIGSHGGIITDETRKHKFWVVFINFCQENAVKILKEELIKSGIPIK